MIKIETSHSVRKFLQAKKQNTFTKQEGLFPCPNGCVVL
jgi:hypothetical protein